MFEREDFYTGAISDAFDWTSRDVGISYHEYSPMRLASTVLLPGDGPSDPYGPREAMDESEKDLDCP